MSERLYDIGESLRDHLESTPFIDAETGEVDPGKLIEWENGIAQLQADFRDKLEAVGIVASELKGGANQLGDEIRRLQARKASLEGQRRRLLAYATDEMIKSDIGKHRSPRNIFTVYLQKGPNRVEVISPAALPEEYKRVTIEPKLTDLAKALKVGMLISHENGDPGISIIPGSQGVRYQ